MRENIQLMSQEMATKRCPICEFETGHHPNCPNRNGKARLGGTAFRVKMGQ